MGVTRGASITIVASLGTTTIQNEEVSAVELDDGKELTVCYSPETNKADYAAIVFTLVYKQQPV
jgi:hypothetical protein